MYTPTVSCSVLLFPFLPMLGSCLVLSGVALSCLVVSWLAWYWHASCLTFYVLLSPDLSCLFMSCTCHVHCVLLVQDFPVVSCHVLFALSCIISCFFLSCFSGLVFIYPTLSSLFLSDLVMNCIICIVPAFYSIVLGICLLYYLRYPKFVFQISLCHDLPSSCSLQIIIMQPIPSYIF